MVIERARYATECEGDEVEMKEAESKSVEQRRWYDSNWHRFRLDGVR